MLKITLEKSIAVYYKQTRQSLSSQLAVVQYIRSAVTEKVPDDETIITNLIYKFGTQIIIARKEKRNPLFVLFTPQ